MPVTMTLEAYAAGKRDEIHTDVLLKPGKLATNVVKHFERQYCKTKRTQRLLDDRETRKGPLSFPKPLETST
ncbi:hypothetical protein CRYUN_Cryun26dG0017000 [Craigia yunnanensis]